MGDAYAKLNTLSANLVKTARDNIFNFFLYLLVLFAVVGLGLFNWANLSFQPELLKDPSYVLSVLFEVFCYGAIIGSFSIDRLMFKKASDVDYNNDLLEVRDYQAVARIKKVSEYVAKWNYDEKRKALLSKYGIKEEQARRKCNFYEASMIEEWLSEIGDINTDKSQTEVVALLHNCGLYIKGWGFWFIFKLTTALRRRKARKKAIKVYKLMRIQANIDDYVMHERVAYNELYFEDLILKVGDGSGKGVNRTKESVDVARGTAFYMVQIFIGAMLIASIALRFNKEQLVDTLAKSAIMIAFVALSVVKGKVNGQRVFENNTINKVTFMRQHLKEYLLYEAEKYNYKPLKVE